MDVFHAIVLGIVQGLTEFLPISSSGHLILIPWLFGWDDGGLAFDAALHLGTLLAVFAYFWRDLLGMFKAVPDALRSPRDLLQRVPLDSDSERVKSARLLWLLVIGSIPGGIAGLLLQGKIDDFFHGDAHVDRAIILISLAMILVAIALWYADRTARHRRAISDLMPTDALAIGLAQMLALFPGVSRSGSTMTAGLMRDLKRPDAASFSFLLGTPLITLAALKGLFDLITNGSGDITGLELAAGMAASAITGFITITFLLRYLKRSSVTVFVIYRIAAGIVFIGIALSSWR
jgi:undecaprenyl-diphosphatase